VQYSPNNPPKPSQRGSSKRAYQNTQLFGPPQHGRYNLGGSGSNLASIHTTGTQTNPNPLRSPRGVGQGNLSPRQLHTIAPRARTESDVAVDDYNRSLASNPSFTINLTPVDSLGSTTTPSQATENTEENFTAIFSPRRKKEKGVSPRGAVNYSEGPRSPRAGYGAK
jgi:hypothetical protein